MKKLFSFMLFLTVLISASCSTKQQPQQYSPYQNQDLNISLNVPSSWEKADITGLFVFFRAPEKNGFNASFGVLVDEENKSLLQKTQKEFFEENKNVIADFKILNFAKTSLAGEECIVATFDSTGEEGKIRQKEYILNHNGKLFILIFTSSQKDYKEYAPVFDRIASSLTFTD